MSLSEMLFGMTGSSVPCICAGDTICYEDCPVCSELDGEEHCPACPCCREQTGGQ